jgi:hypothetical protein
MRNHRLVFERALLVALALPALAACGGQTAYSADAGPTGEPPPPPTAPDAAACGWAAAPPGTFNSDCTWLFTFTGDPSACGLPAGGPTPAECAAICGKNAEGNAADSCGLTTLGGAEAVECFVHVGSCAPMPGNGGRRPEFFASLGFGPVKAGRELGTHFARVACMEAGSVEAFRMLRDELRAHGAPKRLVEAASRSMRDEMRHVRQTSALARRFGEEPIAPVPIPARPPRSLEALALENAVEGCVRETYSALECMWQSHVAEDPVVRATMTRIARDEMSHLALSWKVHAWAMSRLSAAARARVQQAQRDEIAALGRELVRDPEAPLLRTAGLPRAAHSRALVASIAAEVDRAA